jgi:hypothetical protein
MMDNTYVELAIRAVIVASVLVFAQLRYGNKGRYLASILLAIVGIAIVLLVSPGYRGAMADEGPYAPLIDSVADIVPIAGTTWLVNARIVRVSVLARLVTGMVAYVVFTYIASFAAYGVLIVLYP